MATRLPVYRQRFVLSAANLFGRDRDVGLDLTMVVCLFLSWRFGPLGSEYAESRKAALAAY